MKNALIALFFIFLLCSCASTKLSATDPHLSWTAPTVSCDGTALVGGPLRYNVYAISGNGPIPTIATPLQVPCGVLQLASGTPLNSSPVTSGTVFDAIVTDGTWTFAVEAVSPSGSRSELSNQVTVLVQGHPGKPVNLVIALNLDGSITLKLS